MKTNKKQNLVFLMVLISCGLIAQEITTKIFNKSNSPIIPKCFTSISSGPTGLIWIGTLEGVFCYNGNRWGSITTKNSKIPSNKILSMETIGNTIYIGTTKGFLEYNIKNSDWKIYNTSNSLLPSNKIRKIKKDSKNNLWIATSEGLVKYHKEFEVVLSEEKNGNRKR